MNNEDTTHIGVVTELTDSICTIRIDTPVNCNGCAASSLCNKTDDSITVDKSCVENGTKLGEKVKIEISPKMTWNAILYSTVLPLVILVVATVLTELISGSETAACIASIICVILYYFICKKLNIFTVRKTKYNFKIYRYIN